MWKAAETEQAQKESDTLVKCIQEIEAASALSEWKLCVIARALQPSYSESQLPRLWSLRREFRLA